MNPSSAHAETPFRPLSAWPIVALQLGLIAATIAFAVPTRGGILAFTALPFVLLVPGYFIVPPNVSRVLVLFGRYRGTVRREGFFWTNPFTNKKKVSLKAHNLNGERIKVNDLVGNPIEIAAVVVWQVRDTARAVFDVEDFTHFVSVQSEAAVRALASRHPYDEGHHDVVHTTLRGSATEVAAELQEVLQQRLDRAGVEVIEARLSHLAYAQEIASAMLQRQQATAIIAARAKIVEGAVGMVEMALDQLAKGGRVELDGERRATLVGNLLVVLCSHENPQPVLNTGSLYT
jgi:regulator of protease activity HflC (stomatin/prohibitin superfamily)